jgi:hypothetical protein
MASSSISTAPAPGAATTTGWFTKVDSSEAPWLALSRILVGTWLSQSVYAVARLGIADLLVDSPRSSADLAAATEVQPQALSRVLRLLASVGVFTRTSDARFALTPVSQLLTTNAPTSLRDLAIMMGEQQFPAWGAILHSLRTGVSAFRHVFGEDYFPYIERRPDEARTFHAAMAGAIHARAAALAQSYDFSGFSRLVDVGGGSGVVLASVLAAYPNLHGVLLDLRSVTGAAQDYLATAGVADRCEIISGNAFDAVPAGGDIYLVSQVIHLFDDGPALALLRNCRAAMDETARLLLVEGIVPEGNEPADVKALDLLMLLVFGGQERTESEFRALFDAVGLRLSGVVPMPRTGTYLVEAVPVRI